MALTGEPLQGYVFPDDAIDREGQEAIVSAFAEVLDGLYAHLPLKRAMHGIDPVQQLRRLLDRVRSQSEQGLDDATFHAEMTRIVTSLRDAHTIYVGPATLRGKVARLPFLVEEYTEMDRASGRERRRYLVSKVVKGGKAKSEIADAEFVPGVEITTWNGAPIAAAINRHAERERGGRPDSARARAVESLTFRSLRYGRRPDEDWVDIGYVDLTNRARKATIPWRVIEPLKAEPEANAATPESLALAYYPDRAEVRRAKKAAFNHPLWKAEEAARETDVVTGDPAEGWISGRFQDAVSARTVATQHHGDFGYLRLWSFDLLDDDAYIREVIQLLKRLPDSGLIVDLRGNPGGLIWAAERVLQLFTPNRIEPTTFSLVATDLTRALAGVRHNEGSMGRWQRSLNDAVSTGELYSQALPITPVERCNNIGQVYGGPVLAVVDATTYSAGDLFAAGFADNDIGTVVSVGEATGAGGANVWSAKTVNVALAGTEHRPRLPEGVSFTIATRRATRIGAATGMPIEDVGVSGHRRYAMSKRDLTESNADLLDLCGSLLASEPTTELSIEWDTPMLSITTKRLNRVDVYADDRPHMTLDVVADGPPAIRLELPDAEVVRVEGYRGQTLRQSRLCNTSVGDR